eukprot:TRINITY_DN1780_c0_g2_i2.p1 TRINITY_DN1780_c0_g2~~TRINITY_DN1780_c0_g2_i2.p1  ORF type:complete len:414 (+),score=70.39 TRINITY_DN1780_c0_g2_i2:181-1422(+)
MFRAIQAVAGLSVLGGVLGPLAIQRMQPESLNNVATSCLLKADPENAHKLAIYLTKKGISPTDTLPEHPELQTELWGQEARNCVGLAAGFDKDGEAIWGLGRLGFGMIEIGSVTPQPQDGNDTPRVFRLPEDEAVINRYGFNSGGILAARGNLRRYRTGIYGNGDPAGVNFERFAPRPTDNGPAPLLGVNLGKNKEPKVSADHDYVAGILALGPFADYLVINVSSPNTPGLRTLQAREHLGPLLEVVVRARDTLIERERTRHPKLPVVLKIAPDLSDDEAKDIANVAREYGIDGLIVSNTTLSRDGLTSEAKSETGGMSGRPLMDASTKLLRTLYQHTRGEITIIGVGGISSGEDAYRKIRAGASAVQVYTGLVYQGPGLVRRIKDDLAAQLAKDGFKHVSEAVGADVRAGGK